MKIEAIFTPNDVPTVTYVDRSEQKLEQSLRDLFSVPKMVISLSGPSKSGKTVLIKRVFPEEYLITIAGAGITSADNLWQRVLNWMGAPSESIVSASSSNLSTAGVALEAKAKIPLIADAGGTANLSTGQVTETGTSRKFLSGGLDQVIKEIGNSEFSVFVDDFHYIKPEYRSEIGKQIKVAAENGVRILAASVPHRTDDVVRSNVELRGRVAAVDLSYWDVGDIVKIAEQGFAELKVVMPTGVAATLASEAFGSPQLMQSICLNLCYTLGVRESLTIEKELSVSQDQVSEALLKTSSFTDFSKMVGALHTGPRTRGTERKLHQFIDGTRGDVYRSVLLAIKSGRASLSFSYNNILDRVRDVCVGEAPVGSSITSALEQMKIIADEVQPDSSPISWDGDALDVVDPYFLFFLRFSLKLENLGRSEPS